MKMSVLRTLCVAVFIGALASSDGQESPRLLMPLAQTWAQKLGAELWNCGKLVTRRDEVQESFKSADVEVRDGRKLVKEIAENIKNMMASKISAVKRIMDAAETLAVSHQDEVVTQFDYYNAKNLSMEGSNTTARTITLTQNRHFNNVPVNTSFSVVHVPTNVYDGAEEVLKAIKWSEHLDNIFTNNYRNDPSLSWQYFGSSFGFMRQYPAMKWVYNKVDLYDCRTRSWYIEAANSPKDIIILVDNSGSMTGIRKEIARHVVNNILDTLGNNDFVNVYNFSESIDEVVPCFSDVLVQANLANIRELKLGMEDLYTDKIANFSLAFNKAFELLEQYREEKRGACCNQAIMLVTDGVPYNYKEIFKRYNWRNLPAMPVRVFTYLIGKEVADVREVKWMACANQGYFVKLSTLYEVREKVLQYVPVMSRPMVLQKTVHPTIWTPVYADITDPKMTDWLWEVEECAEQKKISEIYVKDKANFDFNEKHAFRYVQKMKRVRDQHGDPNKYKMMISVSMPVFDRRENANITERLLVNEAIWVEKTRESRIANLLGVAGTDVPIEDIAKLMTPQTLGVNGYAFIVTNNGYILIHPDLRPVFQGILKPSYNSVDMAEVELVDDNNEPRVIDEAFLKFRSAVINQEESDVMFHVKYHYDDMKRVSKMKRRYFYRGIENTPFSLVITIPDKYGLHRVKKLEELVNHRPYNHQKGPNVKEFFSGRNWKIHPDWIYCKYHFDTEHTFDSPEMEFKHFLDKSLQPGWRWPLNRTFPPPESANTSVGKTEKVDKDSYFCDRDIVLSLVWDAKVTAWFPRNFSASSKEDKPGPIAMLMVLLPRKVFMQRFKITVAFVATHSGLTRWQDFPGNEDVSQPHFSDVHKRAVDEIWYQRAVEQHFVDPESFVYAVPFDAGDANGTLVTASHAIFHTSSANGHKAPAAVVGLQFRHSALHAQFINITSDKCLESSSVCGIACDSPDLDCYVLDNSGFIVVAESLKDTGRFFGEVKGYIMEMMVVEGIYKKVHVYDYQAVCFRGEATVSEGSFLLTPFKHMKWLFDWLIGNIMWSLFQMNLSHFLPADAFEKFEDDDVMVETEGYEENQEAAAEGHGNGKHKDAERIVDKLLINRTRPAPCDMEVDLYQLHEKFNQSKSRGCDRPFLAQTIPHSNLVLVVVDTVCAATEGVPDSSVMPTEITYGNSSSLPCHKVLDNRTRLDRRRPKSCINSHPDENKIELCGGSSANICKWSLPLISASLLLSLHRNAKLIASSFR